MLNNPKTSTFLLLAVFLAGGVIWSQNRHQGGGAAPAPPSRSAPAPRAAAPGAAPRADSAPHPHQAPSADRGGRAQASRQAPGAGQAQTRNNVGVGGAQGTVSGGRQTGGVAGSRGGTSAAAGNRPPRFSTPSRTVMANGGIVGRVDDRGQVTSIRGNGIAINHGARGERTIIAERDDHSRLVSVGPQHGFIERPVVRGGQPYMQRTYVVNGRSYARVYRGGYYRGFTYYYYVPSVIFDFDYYGWAYRPWRSRVFFNWGWGPWFNWYGYYFSPYPYYLDASMWLTDYVISQQLQDSYDAGYNAALRGQDNSAVTRPGQSSYAQLTPELKQAIADEVRAQLGAQNGAVVNSQAMPDALNPNIRTFIVSTGLTEQLPSGAECFLSPGDVLTRIDDNPDANYNVRAMVSSSQTNDCPAGSQLMLNVQDLQDMHNAFRERVEGGLKALAQTQGKNGIPPGPAANPVPFAEGTAQPDPGARAELQQQRDEARQAERNVQDAAQLPDD